MMLLNTNSYIAQDGPPGHEYAVHVSAPLGKILYFSTFGDAKFVAEALDLFPTHQALVEAMGRANLASAIISKPPK